MVPIKKLKSRTLTLGQREWIKKRLWNLKWVDIPPKTPKWMRSFDVVWRDNKSDQYYSLLSAAKAAGIKYVPAL